MIFTSDTINSKRLIRRYVNDADDIRIIISRCAIKADDKRILEMILIERHNEGLVADTLGYSYSQIKRRFAVALESFMSVAKTLHYI